MIVIVPKVSREKLKPLLRRFLPGIYQNDAALFDWTTYLVDREFAVYKGQVPVGVGRNNFKELPAGDIHLMKRVTSMLKA